MLHSELPTDTEDEMIVFLVSVNLNRRKRRLFGSPLRSCEFVCGVSFIFMIGLFLRNVIANR